MIFFRNIEDGQNQVKLLIGESDDLGRERSVELKMPDIGYELSFLTLESNE